MRIFDGLYESYVLSAFKGAMAYNRPIRPDVSLVFVNKKLLKAHVSLVAGHNITYILRSQSPVPHQFPFGYQVQVYVMPDHLEKEK